MGKVGGDVGVDLPGSVRYGRNSCTHPQSLLYFHLRFFISCRMTDWETAPAVAETPEIKLFGKWSTDDVQINDISLQVLYLHIILLKPTPISPMPVSETRVTS